MKLKLKIDYSRALAHSGIREKRLMSSGSTCVTCSVLIVGVVNQLTSLLKVDYSRALAHSGMREEVDVRWVDVWNV